MATRQEAPTLLVVDDAPQNRRLLVDLLDTHGFRTLHASDGEEALALISAKSPDLVLLDVLMPGLDGFEVCRRIRADPANGVLPVVLVTALDPQKERLHGIEAGADDFITKPFSVPELIARVRSLLRIKLLYDTVQQQADELSHWSRELERRVAEETERNVRLARLTRFLSPQLVRRIVAGEADEPLRSHRRDIAVVYLDLRGFTAFSERTEPEEVMKVLAELHTEVGTLAHVHQGTIERFTGDGMMIFLNDPEPIDEPAIAAVQMAVAMRDAAIALSERWQRKGYSLALAIGVARGYATLGTIGFEGRIDYAAIGAVTNLACRLCQIAQGNEILIGQRVHAEIASRAQLEFVGDLDLYGFSRPMPAWRVVGLH